MHKISQKQVRNFDDVHSKHGNGGKERYLSDFDCGMVAGLRIPGLLISSEKCHFLMRKLIGLDRFSNSNNHLLQPWWAEKHLRVL